MTVLLLLSVPVGLGLGAWLAASLDRAAPLLWGGRAREPMAALADGAALLKRQTVGTEAPDRLTRLMAPVTYLALAAVGLAVVPLVPGAAPVESPVGIVVWGSAEALTPFASSASEPRVADFCAALWPAFAPPLTC